MRGLLGLIAALAIGATISSCHDEQRSYVPSISDNVPTMSTTDVVTMISDSGYTRYRITTSLWEMYDEAAEPHWRFPSGLHLQQYDARLRPDASIRCDSATYLTGPRLWRLDGHVVMVNTARDSFVTEQLFWDQTRRLVYSDSSIHIVRSDRIIDGIGFLSNENMTEYTVHRPTGILPVNRDAQSAGSESAPATDATAGDEIPTGRRPAPVRASERTTDLELSEGARIAEPVKTVKHF